MFHSYIDDDDGDDFNNEYHDDYDYGDDLTSIKDLFWSCAIIIYN